MREYINWYNYHRSQEKKLKGMTPMEFRKSYLTK
ncbi:IS3 family transposase [Streptococcus mutans]|nr:IS3 family transposase [Streptococcus mutans]